MQKLVVAVNEETLKKLHHGEKLHFELVEITVVVALEKFDVYDLEVTNKVVPFDLQNGKFERLRAGERVHEINEEHFVEIEIFRDDKGGI